MGSSVSMENNSLANFIIDEFIKLFKYMNGLSYNSRNISFDPVKVRRYKSCPLLHDLSLILSREIRKNCSYVHTYWDQKFYAEFVSRKMMELLFSIEFTIPGHGLKHGIDYVDIDNTKREFLVKTLLFRKKFFNNDLGFNTYASQIEIWDLENKFIEFIFVNFVDNFSKLKIFISDANYSLRKIYQSKKKKSSIYIMKTHNSDKSNDNAYNPKYNPKILNNYMEPIGLINRI